MPNFEAEEREVTLAAVPGTKIPEADHNFLRELGATEFYPPKWEYRHPKHGLRDVLRPGYFAGETRAHMRAGDEIHYTMEGGRKLPSEWDRGILVVEENPNTREKPLICAILHRYSKPTPVRHDGEVADDAPKTKAAA